jgi:hypothetical protein
MIVRVLYVYGAQNSRNHETSVLVAPGRMTVIGFVAYSAGISDTDGMVHRIAI